MQLVSLAGPSGAGHICHSDCNKMCSMYSLTAVAWAMNCLSTESGMSLQCSSWLAGHSVLTLFRALQQPTQSPSKRAKKKSQAAHCNGVGLAWLGLAWAVAGEAFLGQLLESCACVYASRRGGLRLTEVGPSRIIILFRVVYLSLL